MTWSVRVALSALFVVGCQDQGSADVECLLDSTPGVTPARAGGRLEGVESWVYQLQGKGSADLDPTPFITSGYDLAVIDYSRDGSEGGEFTASEISALKAGGKKIVLAYVSIGEAEEDRFYFDTLPDDLVSAANPAFKDNYKIPFCDARWQKVVTDYVDRVIAQGFDGVYLDIIDGYRYFTPGCARFCEDECEGETAAADMAAFVATIARHARVTRGEGNFIVVPQNGAEIIDQLSDAGAAYLKIIDGIGQEDAFYYDEDDTLSVDADLAPQCVAVIPALDRFVEKEKLVLSVDYLTDDDKIADFYARARARGWVPFAASSRDLDRMDPVVVP